MKRFVALCLMAVALATAPAFSTVHAFSDAFIKGRVAYIDGDYKTALREWLPLAEQGNSSAQYLLGAMYKEGEGVSQDYKEAVKWYTLSAEQGSASAQFALGGAYFDGEGVAQDSTIGYMWYIISGVNGNTFGEAIISSLEALMTRAQIEKAQDLARECIAKDYKGC